MVCESVRELIHSLKLVDYLPIQAHKPHASLALSWNLYPEVVVFFCYLGDMFSAGGGCEITVTTCVKTAWKKFRVLLPVLTSRHLSYKTRVCRNISKTQVTAIIIAVHVSTCIIIKPTGRNTISTNKYNYLFI